MDLSKYSNEEILAADIVLNHFLYNDPRLWNESDLKIWLNEELIKHNDERFISIIKDDTDTSFNRIHGFLIEAGYIGRVKSGYNDEFLTKEGAAAKKVGGHKKYLKWAKRHRIRKGIEWFIANLLIPTLVALTLYYTCSPRKDAPQNKNATEKVNDSLKNNHP